MNTLLLVIIGFLAGSLPFSLWLGRLALRMDIRTVGDGNPGATNVLRAGGKKWGALALLLDALKGAIPVAVAHYALGITGVGLWAVAMAPPLGHAYSPLLGFRGGKALASSAGVWCGLTIWEIPTIGGLLLGFWFAFIDNSGWAVIFMLLSTLAYLLLTGAPPILLAVLVGHFLLLAWKYRADLRVAPHLRGWFTGIPLPWHSS